ncbi:hypothetical protein J4464_05880 [Candidatus Woesearchaeota archaeon]|nr:hypothetical protein [Candidatus Woesearchaeota archaeon]
MTTKSETPFSDFIGEFVKAPYRDGSQLKIARGRLEEVNDGFVKVTGKLGTIIINAKNIEKMSKIKDNHKERERGV